MDALGEYLSAEIWTKDTAFSWKAFFQEGLRVFLQGLEKDVPKGKNKTAMVDSYYQVFQGIAVWCSC